MSTKASVAVGLIQMAAEKNPAANLKKVLARIDRAAAGGVQIIGLQELFLTPYFCQSEDPTYFKLAEPIPGPTTDVLSRAARKNKVVIVAPLFEKRTAGIYHNSAAVLDAGGELLGTYRKMHIPDDPNFYEKFYFTPGDLGFPVFQTRYARIAVLICWDQWFPEAARIVALEGAQILFYPTAIAWHDRDKKFAGAQREGWEVVQRGHAVANQVYVAVTNRSGREGRLNFWGNSFVSDPFGKVTARAPAGKEDVDLIVPCDLNRIEEVRRDWPFFRDRRVDAYQGISERFLDHARDFSAAKK